MSIKRRIIIMSWNPRNPHNSLPDLPPAVELETNRVLKQCIRSRTALEKVNQSAAFLPNKELLIHVMPLLEAQASSEIENIVTTTDQLFRSNVLESESDAATKEALHYRNALYHGYQSLAERPLSTATAETICSVIKQKEMRVRSVSGTALGTNRGNEIIYTPPEGEALLRDKLRNWEKFLHQDQSDLDPLVTLAVSHYQFEAIHPFTDGNGRTGRILNLLFLVEKNLLGSPILYHSRGIIRRKDDYYRLLLAVTRDSAWEDWILYMLEVLEESAEWTWMKIDSVRQLRKQTKSWLRKTHPAFYSAELLDVLFHYPYCRISNLVDAGIAKRQAASTYLNALCESGLLQQEKVGREKLFLHRKFLNLLLD